MEGRQWSLEPRAVAVRRGEGEFLGLLKTGAHVALTLDAANLEGLFDLGYHLKQVDIAFERVFGQMSGPVEALRALAVII